MPLGASTSNCLRAQPHTECTENPDVIRSERTSASCLQSAGRDSEALEQLGRVLEIDEHQVVALVSMAMIYADQGDLAQALAIARRAHAVAPWYPDAIAVLSALARRGGQDAESLSLMPALGEVPAVGDVRAHALSSSLRRCESRGRLGGKGNRSA